MCVLGANEGRSAAPPGVSLSRLIMNAFRLQEGAPLVKPLVEDYGDDLYKDLYDDLAVSTVTLGQNLTDYEVRSKPAWPEVLRARSNGSLGSDL